jgi:hypothetical protein
MQKSIAKQNIRKRIDTYTRAIILVYIILAILYGIYSLYVCKILIAEQQRVYPEIENIDFRDYRIDTISYIATPPIREVKTRTLNQLDMRTGVCYGPSGKETYYNLPMGGVIKKMRAHGYTDADYPYIEREDGVKCLGSYVMVAADLNKYRRGEIIETSLGQGIVCDTGTFAETDPDQIDIAVTW